MFQQFVRACIWQISRTLWCTGQQAQGLDDLEDILNSPAPALGPTSFDPGHLPLAECSQKAVSASDSIAPAAIPDTGSAAANLLQKTSGATGSSLAPASKPAQADVLLQGRRQAPRCGLESPKASVWSTAYQSASAPLAAVWARIPEQLQRIPSLTVASLTTQCSYTVRPPSH